MRGVGSVAARRRLSATLARRGFDFDVVRTVIERLKISIDPDDSEV
jgi:hypothetical protein